jgi:hypothetical protein
VRQYTAVHRAAACLTVRYYRGSLFAPPSTKCTFSTPVGAPGAMRLLFAPMNASLALYAILGVPVHPFRYSSTHRVLTGTHGALTLRSTHRRLWLPAAVRRRHGRCSADARRCARACSGTARVCSDVRVLTGYSKVLKGTHTVPRNLPRTSNARSGSSGRTRATRQALHGSVGYTEYGLCGMAVSGTPRHSRRPSWASVFDGQVLNAAWSRSCRAV